MKRLSVGISTVTSVLLWLAFSWPRGGALGFYRVVTSRLG